MKFLTAFYRAFPVSKVREVQKAIEDSMEHPELGANMVTRARKVFVIQDNLVKRETKERLRANLKSRIPRLTSALKENQEITVRQVKKVILDWLASLEWPELMDTMDPREKKV